MKILKLFYITALCLTISGVSHAYLSQDDAGTSSALFLKSGAGARSAGMGDAFSAVTGDANSLYWNPAGLSKFNGVSISLMHALWFEDISYEWAALAFSSGGSAFGIGVQYLSYGEIPLTDETGLQTNTFSPTDMSITGAYSLALGNTHLGQSFKYISLKIVNSTYSFAGDFGLLQTIPMGSQKLEVAAVLQNVGPTVKFITDEYPLPQNVKFGLAYYPSNDLIIAADLNFPSDNVMYYGAGLEYGVKLAADSSIALRAGYNSRNISTGTLSGFTAGAGLKFKDYEVNYAFVPFGDLGNTHRISLDMIFGETPAVPAPEIKEQKPKFKLKFKPLSKEPLDKKTDKIDTKETKVLSKKEVMLTEAEKLAQPQAEITAEKAIPQTEVKTVQDVSSISDIKKFFKGGLPINALEASSWKQSTGLINFVSLKVSDSEGKPISTTVIKVSKDGNEVLRGFTDSDGKFKTYDLRPGKYEIKLWKSNNFESMIDDIEVKDAPLELEYTLEKN